jgi:hypothetical protein
VFFDGGKLSQGWIATILMVYRSPPSKREMRQGEVSFLVSSTLETIKMVLLSFSHLNPNLKRLGDKEILSSVIKQSSLRVRLLWINYVMID